MLEQQLSSGQPDAPAVVETLRKGLDALATEDFTTAVESVEAVLTKTPDHAVALHILGLVAVRMSEPGRAIELLKAAHNSDPACREHCDALAIVYAKVGNLQESLYHGKLATALTPNETYPGLIPGWLGSFEASFTGIEDSPLISAGEVLMKAGQFLEAAHHFRNAAELDSKDVRAWRGLADALRHANRPIDADVAFQALVSLSPDHADDLSAMARNLTAMGAFDEARETHAKAVIAGEARAELYSAMLQDRRFDPAFAVPAIAEAEAAWAAAFAFQPFAPPPAKPDSAPRKLRLGLVSGRFRAGTGLDLFFAMLAHAATSSVAVHCYNNNPFNDVVTRRLQGYVEGWVDIFEVDDETAATIIRNDGIDVLLDLDGHGDDGRPRLFTYRPATTALRCWGLPQAAAAQGYDGVLGDGVVYDEGAEGAVRVEGGILPVPQKPDSPLPTSDREGGLVFGTLASRAQLNAGVIDAWEAILKEGHCSLLLHPDWLGGIDVANELKRAFAARACDDSVQILGLSKDTAVDTARYFEAVDAVLEPFPMPSLERIGPALTHGKPPIALAGELPEARIVPSLMAQMGLDSLVADDVEAYVSIATACAQDRASILAARDRIAKGLSGEIKHLSPKARLDALADAVIAHYRSVA